MEGAKTIAHALRIRARELGDAPALFTKRDGVWQARSWRAYGAEVERFARGLMALGLQPGEAVGIISFNRAEWHIAAYGAMSAGGFPVGIYTTSSPEQVGYIVGHCEARVVVVENAAQLAKVASQRTSLPKLQHLVLLEGKADGALTYEEVLAKAEQVPSGDFDRRLADLDPEGLATLIYTSGTTGPPKGVEITHHNVTWTAEHLNRAVGSPMDQVVLSYLPLSHIAEQVVSMYGSVWNRFQVYFAESLEKLPENLREVRPTLFFAVPRVWEKFKVKLEAAIAEQPPGRQRLVARARKVADAYHQKRMLGLKPDPLVALQYALFRKVVFQKLHARLGFDRCERFCTAAAPIGLDVLEFFRSMDMVLLETYGQSEVTGPTSVSGPDSVRLGRLGRPMPGVTVKIAEDGEILVKGGNVCRGYYKDPAATAELLEGGWLHSGDVGELDEEGFLRITDRKKDLIVTSGGKKAAPQELEKRLRAIRPVGQAVVVGERRNYLCALLTLDPDKARSFAKERQLPEAVGELVKREELREAIQKEIDAMNAQLSRFESIKKFVLLEKEFTMEAGELTPSLKLKRKVVTERYARVIEGLYEGD